MSNELIEIKKCEVCGSENLDSALNLGLHPMCDDLVKVGEDRVCREYPIEILYCKKCNTAHQRYQVPKQDLFPKNYHYRSRFTKDVLDGMEDLVNSCEEKFGDLRNKTVLDIGCNDGSLLDFFSKKGAITLGVEPTNASQDVLTPPHVVYADFFSKSTANEILKKHGYPDFITFTNVFAHIEDLRGLLDAIEILIADHTVLVIENHYLGSVLKGYQFDTFYHEHPRTYSYTSFIYIAKLLNLNLLSAEFPSRYGGNIRIFMGMNNKQKFSDRALSLINLIEEEENFFAGFSLLRKKVDQWQLCKKVMIESELLINGKLIAKAFPGRAAILVKLLELDENYIAAVYEKPGSMKIGHYVPGTRIPIRSDEELDTNDKGRVVLNLAWHISREIKNYMTDLGFCRVIDIFEANELT